MAGDAQRDGIGVSAHNGGVARGQLTRRLRQPRLVGGKAGTALAAFVRLVESMRAATAGLPLPESVAHVLTASGLLAHYRAEKDPRGNFLYLNPGACGRQGFHLVKTFFMLEILAARVTSLRVIELGPR